MEHDKGRKTETHKKICKMEKNEKKRKRPY